MIKISWDLEEMVAMVNLYYMDKKGLINDITFEFTKLSTMLNKRANILNISHDDKFRNINGMRMIFQNVRYFDTNGTTGLSSANKCIEQAVRLYQNENDIFIRILNEFNRKYK